MAFDEFIKPADDGERWTDMAGIELRSPSFGDHQPIPARHAKDHDNLSPALEWSGVPQEAVGAGRAL